MKMVQKKGHVIYHHPQIWSMRQVLTKQQPPAPYIPLEYHGIMPLPLPILLWHKLGTFKYRYIQASGLRGLGTPYIT